MGHGAILPSSGETVPLQHQRTEHVNGASLSQSGLVEGAFHANLRLSDCFFMDAIIHNFKLHSKMWCNTFYPLSLMLHAVKSSIKQVHQ